MGRKKWKIRSDVDVTVRSIVTFSPESGAVLATGSDDATTRLWQVTNGKLLSILDGHSSAVRSVAFSPKNSALLATGSDDQTARLWDISSDKIGL